MISNLPLVSERKEETPSDSDNDMLSEDELEEEFEDSELNIIPCVSTYSDH